MNLFETESHFLSYVFRIVDNGGETYDRITVMYNDGTASLCTSSGICCHIEDCDPMVTSDRVEAGEERDLRWIDLDPGLRRRLFQSANEGFADWLGSFTPPATRGRAYDWGTAYRLAERVGEGVYGQPGAYMIRREGGYGEPEGQDDLGPYETLAEAVRNTLPDDYDLSGPEYHGTVNLDDEEGGPAPLWDREADPPESED